MTVFTLCSNNYLAQAKTLGDSLLKSNPNYQFVIGLTDELNPSIDYNFFYPYTIIPVADIGIDNFDNLWKKYDIIEFNTCVKASYFKYLFKIYQTTDTIIYLDPDIFVYHSFSILEKEFVDNEILITPHILTPICLDNKYPGENAFLNYGLYNLGFIGVHRNCFVNGFLNWWEERTLERGFNKPELGLFVDQLWINLVPIFYSKVKVLRETGLNVAPWNLHERTVLTNLNENRFLMSDESDLIFYHFSSYDVNGSQKMSKHYERYDFQTHPELIELYFNYNQKLLENNIEQYASIPCSYILKREKCLEEQKIPEKNENKLKKLLKLFVPPILLKIKNVSRRSNA